MLTGHLQRFILTILALSSMHKKAVTGGGCVWVSCTELGGTHSPAEVISRGDHLMNRLSDRVPKAVNIMCVPLICSILSLSQCSPSKTVHPQAVQFITQYSGRSEKEMGFGSIPHSWGIQHLLSISHMEKIMGRESLYWH